MSTPAGFDTGGQGQGPANLNGGGPGTAPPQEQPIQFGQLNQQQQQPQFGQQPQQQQYGQQGGEPPYQQYLNRVPESLRGAIEPIFREWDANYTRNMQQYSDQLRRYEPYEQFTNYDPQILNAAVQLAEMVNTNPEQVFQMLANELNYDVEGDEVEDLSGYGNQFGGYGQQQQQQEDPRLGAMEEALSNLTEMVQGNQAQMEEDRETDNILSYMNDVQQQYGPIDYDFVLGKAYATGDLDGALEEWYNNYAPAMQQSNGQPQLNGNGQMPPNMVEVGGVMVPANHPAAANAAPQTLGSGGGLPSQTQDLGKLSSKDRIALVAQTIAAANQAQGQA